MKNDNSKLILTFIVSLVVGILTFVYFLPELTYIVKLWDSETLLGGISAGLAGLFAFLMLLPSPPLIKARWSFYQNHDYSKMTKEEKRRANSELQHILKGIKTPQAISMAMVALIALFLPTFANFLRQNWSGNDYHVAGDYLIYYRYPYSDLCDWHGNVIIGSQGEHPEYGIATNENGQTILLQGYYTIKCEDSDTYFTYTITGYDNNSHLPILKATFKTIEDRGSEVNLNELIENKLNLIIKPIGSFSFYGGDERLIDYDIHVVNKAQNDSRDEESKHETVCDDNDKYEPNPEPNPTPKPHPHTRAVEKFYPCGGCGGSTYCGVCYGSGWVGNPNNQCASCYGRKICTMCGGRGGEKRIEYVEEFY